MDHHSLRKHCVGCIYYHGDFRANLCCNYIFDTGHRRPCPPGERCTVKTLRPVSGASADPKTEQKF